MSDPRAVLPPPVRYTPALLGSAAVLAVGAAGVGAASLARAPRPPPPAVAQALRAPAAVLTRVQLRPGETLAGALTRTGVQAAEARAAVALLGNALDTAHIRAGFAFRALVSRNDGRGPAHLLALSAPTGPASRVQLSRMGDGALALRRTTVPLHDRMQVVSGRMQGSLYASAIAAGASPDLVAAAVRLFGKTVDFARDIQPGDGFRLVFDRKATPGGRAVGEDELLYAELATRNGARRFYRFDHDGRADYLDDVGQAQQALLLKTPLDGAHVTSAFGMRVHPVLGYSRMHQGVDFGAPTGTPVFAAGDGVVEEARWNGGYGHWLKIGHAGTWETGYGHLSAYARGVRPGVRVRQGQVVGYVGSTGLSTGPHLHYEIMKAGAKIDPAGARVPQGSGPSPQAIALFHAQRARIDAALDASAAAGAAGPRPIALRRAPAD